MDADGNCLFRSISDQLYGHPNNHADLWALAVEKLTEGEELYKFYIEDDQSFQSYVQDLQKDGEWGSQLEMAVLAE